MKKIMKTVLLLCVAASMLAGAVSVNAATYELLTADVMNAASENFDSYTADTEYVQIAASTEGAEDVEICENWAITSGSNKTLATTTKARVTAATTTTDEETGEVKEARSAHLEVGHETSDYYAYRNRNSYVTYTGDVSKIGLPYKIKFDLYKDSFNSTAVIRFGIDSTKENYYQLVLTGKTKGDANKQWLFEKVEGSKVTSTVVPDWDYKKTDAYDNEFIKKATVEIIVAEDGVSWHIDGNNAISSDGTGNDYSANYREYIIDGTFKDSVKTGNMGIGFVTHSAGDHAVRIDNFSISDYSKYVGAEAEPDAIYTDIVKSVDAADGTVKLAGKYPVRKIVNNSAVATEVCVPSGDTYLTLAEIPAGEAFLNTLTEATYDTLKVIGGEDISVYTEKINIRGGSDAYVTAVVGGEEAEVASEDGKVVYVDDSRIYGMYDGTATLVASNENGSVSSEVIVNTVSTDTFDYPVSDAVQFTKDGIKSGNLQLGDSPWYLSNMTDTPYGTNAKVSLNGSAIEVTNLTSIGSSSEIYSAGLPVVRYCGDYRGIGDNFKISFDMSKASVTTRTVVKFMMHNDDKNYYYLMLNNVNANSPNWTFGKVVEKEIVATVESEYLMVAAKYTNVLHDLNKIEITVDGNKISWSIDGKSYNKQAFVDSGSFVDADPFTVNPEETTVGFIAQGSASHTMLIDNFSIAPVAPEMKVLDLTEGSAVLKAIAFRDVETGKAIVAKYNADKSLASVEVAEIEDGFAEVKADIASADSAKLIMLEDWTAVSPITGVTVLK